MRKEKDYDAALRAFRLQWGRNLIVAEGLITGIMGPRGAGFNGAAT